MRRLYKALRNQGITLVTTSNRRPDQLYQNGLQRAAFLPFIADLEATTNVHHVASPTDYRQMHVSDGHAAAWIAASGAAKPRLASIFDRIAGGERPSPVDVDVGVGRQLHVRRQAGGVAWFSFEDLCERNLGSSDYIALARNFHTVVLENVPKLAIGRQRDSARRLITLVDALCVLFVRAI